MTDEEKETRSPKLHDLWSKFGGKHDEAGLISKDYVSHIETALILAREELEKALSMNKSLSEENIELKGELENVRQQSAEWERKYLWIRDKREKGIL